MVRRTWYYVLGLIGLDGTVVPEIKGLTQKQLLRATRWANFTGKVQTIPKSTGGRHFVIPLDPAKFVSGK